MELTRAMPMGMTTHLTLMTMACTNDGEGDLPGLEIHRQEGVLRTLPTAVMMTTIAAVQEFQGDLLGEALLQVPAQGWSLTNGIHSMEILPRILPEEE